jgi:rhodanese-related sulfurtransferase
VRICRVKKHIPLLLLMIFMLGGCRKIGQVMDGDGMVREPFYAQISQDEARLMMQDDYGHVIVDVRRADEYAEGHIPGAILIPNEEIGTEEPEELPDKYQVILVYCRTGRRSKEAAQKLANMGYVNVYEFGGIEDWTGDIVTDDTVKYKLTFNRCGFESEKIEYAAGEKVTVRYDIIATDTDYLFFSDDVDFKQDYDGGYVFTFVMPEHDVALNV